MKEITHSKITTTSNQYQKEILNLLLQGEKKPAELERGLKEKFGTFSRNTLNKCLKALLYDERIEKKEVKGKKELKRKKYVYNLASLDIYQIEKPSFGSLNQLFLLNDYLQNPIYKKHIKILQNPEIGPKYKSLVVRNSGMFELIKRDQLHDFFKFFFYILFFHEIVEKLKNEEQNEEHQEKSPIPQQIPAELISEFERKMESANYLVIFSRNNKEESNHDDLNERLYLLTHGDLFLQFQGSVENRVISTLRSLILVEDPVSLNLFEDIALLEWREWSCGPKSKANNQIQKISDKYTFDFFIFLKNFLINKIECEIRVKNHQINEWIFTNQEILERKLGQILNNEKNEPNIHYYINFIESYVLRTIEKTENINRTLELLQNAKISWENKIFEKHFKENADFQTTSGELLKIIKEKLRGGYKLKFKNAKKILFYLFLTTRIFLISQRNEEYESFSSGLEILELWKIFFRQSRKIAIHQNDFAIFEGTSLRHFMMQSIRIFEEFYDYYQSNHPRTKNQKNADLNDYKGFLKDCHLGQGDIENPDETYLIKLYLLIRESSIGIDTFDKNFQETRNPTLLLLFLESLQRSGELEDSERINDRMKKFFKENNPHIPIKRKMSLITGIIQYIVQPSQNTENIVDNHRREMFFNAFEYFNQFLSDHENLTPYDEAFDYKWYLNLLSTYYYFKNRKDASLIASLLGLCFSFENRSLYPEVVLFQLNPKIHTISYGEQPYVQPSIIHPFFMIPFSSMAKILYLISTEEIELNKNEIISALNENMFRQSVKIMHFFVQQSTKLTKIEKKNIFASKNLKALENLLEIFISKSQKDRDTAADFIEFLFKSVSIFYKIFHKVPFNRIFLYKKHINGNTKEEIRKLLKKAEDFDVFIPAIDSQYSGWIISMLHLLNNDLNDFKEGIEKVIEAYPYCTPLFSFYLQFAFETDDNDLKDKIIKKLWKSISDNPFDIYPTYHLGKYLNHWHLYQFPNILKMLLEYQPNPNYNEYLLLLDYFFMKIPEEQMEKLGIADFETKILKKIEDFCPNSKEKYKDMISKVDKFKKRYVVNEYFKISDDGVKPGYCKKYGYYVPDPRPSRLKFFRYVNLPDKIVI